MQPSILNCVGLRMLRSPRSAGAEHQNRKRKKKRKIRTGPADEVSLLSTWSSLFGHLIRLLGLVGFFCAVSYESTRAGG